MLSFRFKIIGIILVISGIVLAIIYFTNRIEIDFPVLAVQSSYLETRYFTIFRTNIFEEITLILLLTGFIFIVFSKEKTEFMEYSKIRNQSWLTAVICNAALTGFFIIFIFGAGFAAFLLGNIFSIYLIYLIVFYYKKFVLRQNQH
jgi:hypothetical protein